jgi:hypothetical protein
MRTMIRSLIELPSWLYQRHHQVWDRVVLAAGWTLLYVLCSGVEPWVRLHGGAGAGLFPPQWRVVLGALIFLGGLWKPVFAYVAFIVAVAYPLYLISIYVMALALAVLILSAPAMAAYAERGALSLAMLILLAPALAPYHLTPLLPLLAGLWWEGAGSWVAGGLAAAWLKLCAGMSGYPVDLWRIHGWTMAIGPVYERFHTANSLQTLVRLIEPFGVQVGRIPFLRSIELGMSEVSYPAPVGVFVLFNLLQVFAWAAAGYVVSALLDRLYIWRIGRPRGWALSALSLGPGLLLIWAGYVAVPFWLQVEGPEWLDPPWLPAQIVVTGLVAWCLDGLLRYLHQPVSPDSWFVRSAVSSSRERSGSTLTRRRSPFPGKRGSDKGQASHEPVRSFTPSGRRRSRVERSQANDQTFDIMIELD